MKKITTVLLAFLFIAQGLYAQSDTILNRYRQYLFATLKVNGNVDELVTSLNANGQWSDIDYQDQERGGWKPLIHMKRLRDLALAYSYPGSPFFQEARVRQSINMALDHWLLHRYKCPNWWHNEIGVPQQMRDVIILFRPELTSKRMEGALEVLAQYQIHPNTTGANLTWTADLGLHYGLLTNDAALAQRCRDLIVHEIEINTADGVQPDYSFHQHDKRLQMYQYGAAFLLENIRLAWELRNTSLAFPKDKLTLLTDFLVKGWQWMTRGINTVPGTMDRSASRIDALHSADVRPLLPYLIDLVPERENELTVIAQHQNGNGALNGFAYYPYSDFTAYQQKDFSFFLKTISTRTLATESINSENLKGHLLNSGDAYMIHDGKEYFNLMPVWNWEYLPGITSFKGADRMVRKPFVGSVGNGKQGFTSMDYLLESKDRSRSISAKKSWFCYDNKVICLVADLRGKGVDTAYTVMDQSRWNNKVCVNTSRNILAEGNHSFAELKWVYHRNFLYAPLTRVAGEVQLHSVTGEWTTINASEVAPPVNEKLFMPLLLHESLSGGAAFGYLMTYSKSDAAAKRLAKKPGCSIIRNDSLCQSVLFDDGTLMAAFYQKGSFDFNKHRLTVNKPCLIMIVGNKLYASDPQQINNGVEIEIDGKKYSIELPGHGFTTKGVAVNLGSGKGM